MIGIHGFTGAVLCSAVGIFYCDFCWSQKGRKSGYVGSKMFKEIALIKLHLGEGSEQKV